MLLVFRHVLQQCGRLRILVIDQILLVALLIVVQGIGIVATARNLVSYCLKHMVQSHLRKLQLLCVFPGNVGHLQWLVFVCQQQCLIPLQQVSA